jgi:hypothetical protein
VKLSIYFDDHQLRKFLGHAYTRWPEAGSRALEKIGRAVYDQSQREVPKGETKTLADSNRFEIHPHTVNITYFAVYARVVHFRKRVHHPTGKRMFLTGPLGKGKRLLGPTIAREVQAAMDRTPVE